VDLNHTVIPVNQGGLTHKLYPFEYVAIATNYDRDGAVKFQAANALPTSYVPISSNPQSRHMT
jgi:hypothetical protein